MRLEILTVKCESKPMRILMVKMTVSIHLVGLCVCVSVCVCVCAGDSRLTSAVV